MLKIFRIISYLFIILLLFPLVLLLFVILWAENKIFNIFSWVSLKTFRDRQIVPFEKLKISFVIPHFNNLNLLDRCIASLLETAKFDDEHNEIIVIDDGSNDKSSDFIKSKYPTVKVLKNIQNKGFIYSCNRGVREARNELVVLLNNDVIVTKNFLLPLIEHFKKDDVFAVSPKIYSYDRKTFARGMEIGGFKQGYFRFWNEIGISVKEKIYQTSPTLYAIGACMIFRKNDFLWLNGFDKIYNPHWWEDIDICYRASKRGLKILYEPESLIYHKEGATIGKYGGSLAIRNEFIFILKNFTDNKIIRDFFRYLPYIIYNGGCKFLLGFIRVLYYLPLILFKRANENKYIKKTDREVLNKTNLYFNNFRKRNFAIQYPKKFTLLILSPFFPLPVRHGLQLKVWNSIKALSENFEIILISFYRNKLQLKNISKLKNYCKEVIPIEYSSNPLKFFKKILYPKFATQWYYNLIFKERLKDIIDNYPIDLILIESTFLIQYVQYINDIPTILVEHDPSVLSFKNRFLKENKNNFIRVLDYIKTKMYFSRLYKNFDEIFVFTEQDKTFLLKFYPNLNIIIDPIKIDLDYYTSEKTYSKDIDLLFVGSFFHYPNFDGLKYFIKEVYPILKSKNKVFNLKIIGSGVSKNKLKNLLKIEKSSNIDILGEVKDIREYLYRTKVFIAPIKIGRGMKIKILEAMACGVPVITTPQAVIGLKVISGRDLLISNNSLEMANNIVRLLEDELLREYLSRNAKKYVYENLNIKKDLILNYQLLIKNKIYEI